MTFTGRELRSRIDESGTLTLSLEEVEIEEPGDDEVIVRVEASPINPSDLGLITGPADMASLRIANGPHPALTATVPPERLSTVRGRLGKSLPVGNEGAGTVVKAGSNAAHLEGKRVGMGGGAMLADYRRISKDDVAVLPADARIEDGASMFINPLTALGFVETARAAGHKAIVHTAAASNLGQILQRICLADGIPLINIVRSQQQINVLRAIGAVHVLNSNDEDFADRLTEVIEKTHATIAFDAIGGGRLGGEILQAMERAAVKHLVKYDIYGSDRFKQLYIYGALDLRPTTFLRPALGFRWNISGWLLWPFLQSIGKERTDRLRERVVRELTTTFASHYTRTIGLAELLDPEVLRACKRMATGEKFLIDPTRD